MNHLSLTLRPAIQLAISNGTKRSEIIVSRWATTYDSTEAKVRKLWAEELERFEREQLTKIPPATISDDIGEGK
jgi:hypothetical protein